MGWRRIFWFRKSYLSGGKGGERGFESSGLEKLEG